VITGIAHNCFIVRDLDAAESFYIEKLGLAHGFDFINAEGRRRGVYLRVGDSSFLELFVGQHDGSQSGSYRHVCLQVDDIAATVAAWRAAGVEVSEPVLEMDLSWQAWLSDPDGNRIELHEYTPESWQVVQGGYRA
jgi:catechol 2,3-dioxygenase-like lactoylglutathione lyase family enzyme